MVYVSHSLASLRLNGLQASSGWTFHLIQLCYVFRVAAECFEAPKNALTITAIIYTNITQVAY